MTDPTLRIVGISGSLRRASYNTALLREAAEVAPPDVSIRLADISSLPLYDADLEREHGFGDAVTSLRSAIAKADGLLLASPEYNWSVTGALKNAIDWASRAPSPLDDLPAAILSTGGRSGGLRSQAHLRDILGHNHLQVVEDPVVALAGAKTRFDTSGRLRDPEDRELVRRLVEALVVAIRSQESSAA